MTDFPKVPEIINVHAAKTHLSRLLERAHGGEEIILAKGGKPYARLMPLAEKRPLQFGLLAGKIQLSDAENAELMRPLSDEELADWE